MERDVIIAGNWKMYKTIEEAKSFIEELAPLVKEAKAKVCLGVPFTAIHASADLAKDTNISVGAQNMHDATEGAFTGEIAASMLKSAGASFVILGHSERRHIFGETNSFINKKIKKALEEGLQPILCIGETLEERENNQTEDVLKTQILESLEGVEVFENLVLAYEPVWAIGTGKTATPEMAQQAHVFCRDLIAEKWGREVADKLPILYGGSVKPENAKELMSCKDIDGGLVGGAALKAENFSKIVHYEG
jgi:triosephosphate isomerase (TIM)